MPHRAAMHGVKAKFVGQSVEDLLESKYNCILNVLLLSYIF